MNDKDVPITADAGWTVSARPPRLGLLLQIMGGIILGVGTWALLGLIVSGWCSGASVAISIVGGLVLIGLGGCVSRLDTICQRQHKSE